MEGIWVGKNNKKMRLEQGAERNPQFGIKKLNVGVVSVAVGAMLSMGLTTVGAEEVTPTEDLIVEQVVVEESVLESQDEIIDKMIESVPSIDGIIQEEAESEQELVSDEEHIEPDSELSESDEEDIEEELLGDEQVDDNTGFEEESKLLDEVIEIDNTESEETELLDSSIETEVKEDINFISETIDIIPPRIIDIYPAQSEYMGWEPRTVTVVVEEENLIDNIDISFRNKAGDLTGWANPENIINFYYVFNNDLVKNELGQYVINLTNTEEPYGDFFEGLYELDYISISDDSGNVYEDNGTEIQSSFNYSAYSGYDFIEPELIDIQFDKEVYKAGETVTVTATARDNKNIEYLYIYLENYGDIEQDRIYINARSNSYYNEIKEIDKNIFQARMTFQLSELLFPSSFKINSYHLEDGMNTVSKYAYNNPDILNNSFEVISDTITKVVDDFETNYTTDLHIWQEGVQGIKYVMDDGRELVIQERVDAFRPYNYEYEYIPYDKVYLPNRYDARGNEYTVSYGTSGEKVVFYDFEGNIITEKILYSPVDEIINVGVSEYINIPYEYEFIANPDLPRGEYGNHIPGKNGYRQLIYNLEGDFIEEIYHAPITGTKEIGTAEYIEEEYETEYRANENMSLGSYHTINYGQNGSKKLVYNLEGELISEEIITEKQNEIIEYGNTRYLPNPYVTVYEFDEWMPEGSVYDYIKVEGIDGSIKEIYDYDGNLLESYVEEPINQVIVQGTIQPTPIPYDIEYTFWDYEVVDGYEGLKYIYPDGSEQIINLPRNEVRLYHNEIVEIPFEIFYHDDYSNPIGHENVLDEGKNGSARIYYDEQGNEVHREYIEWPYRQIIEVGRLTEAMVEEREANPYYTNIITLIDEKSGHVFKEIELKGENYQARLKEYIANFNETYKTNIELSMILSTNTSIENKLINGEYIKTYIHNYVSSIENNSKIDLRDIEYLALPKEVAVNLDHLLYSPYSNVNIYENDKLLISVEFETISGVNHTWGRDAVERSLKLLDNNYIVMTTEAYEGIINIGNRQATGHIIDVYVKERLQKELVEATYKVDYTNDPSQVRQGQNGTRYLYSDGTEKIVEAPINEVRLTETVLKEGPVIDSIKVDRKEYAVGEAIEVTVSGRTARDIETLVLDFYDNTKMKMHMIRASLFNGQVNREDGLFTAILTMDTSDYDKDSNFELLFATIADSMDNTTLYHEDIPFPVSFRITNDSLLGTKPIHFDTKYTTDESQIRPGQDGSKLVYSDGSEVVLEDAVSAIKLYNRQVEEIDFDTDFTIYVHEARSGVKGSKFVYENGEEQLISAPVNAVALYDNEVEIFDFTTLEIANPDLAYGETKVVQEGVSGRRVVFYDADGKIVDKLVVSSPVSRIVQVASRQRELVLTPYETSYTTDAAQVQNGQNGAKYIYSDGLEETITKAVNAVKLYRYADQSIVFEEIIKENNDLALGERRVVKEGQRGSKRLFYDAKDQVVEERILEEAIDRIVEIGTYVAAVEDVIEKKTESRTEAIDYEIEYVDDATLTVGNEVVVTEGKAGITTIVEEVTYVNGKESNRKLLSNMLTSQPINKVIHVGTKAISLDDTATTVKNATKVEKVAFDTVYIDNPDMLVGVEKTVEEGVDGERTIVEKVTTVGGKETHRELVSDEITLAPIKRVVHIGTKAVDEEAPEITELVDEATGIRVELNRNDNIRLVVSPVSFENNKNPNAQSVLGADYSLFDIYLLDQDGNPIQTDGKVTITIPYGLNLNPLSLYHFGDDFEVIEQLEFTSKENRIQFSIDGLSYFGIKFGQANKEEVPTETEADGKPNIEIPDVEVYQQNVATLPETGEKDNVALISLAISSLGMGIALIASKKKDEQES